MIARLLACLVLFTGLAAVGTPASASVTEALSCEIGVAADAMEGSVDDRRACHHEDAGNHADEADKTQKPAKRTRRVLRPPVLYGIDRAYE